MRLSYLVWFLFLAVVSWQDFQKQEISSWLLILMGALGTAIQLFEGSVSLGGWFGGIILGLALLFLAFVTREEIGYGDGWLVVVMGMSLGLRFSFLAFLLALGISALVSGRKELLRCQTPGWPFQSRLCRSHGISGSEKYPKFLLPSQRCHHIHRKQRSD